MSYFKIISKLFKPSLMSDVCLK